MAKNKNKKKKKSAVKEIQKGLPQNIVAVGERVEEDKNIYISQKVYREIHRFTRGKTENESGGVLLGEVKEELGKTNILLYGFIEAKFSAGTPTTLTFTHESWEYIHKEAEKRFPQYRILGWIHTHPDFGIFLSDYDKFIQKNYFGGDDQVAYVVDPVRGIEGFYFKINENLVHCKGFYVFDEVGTKIRLPEAGNTGKDAERSRWAGILLAGVTVLLSVATLLLSANIRHLQEKLRTMEIRQKEWEEAVTLRLYDLEERLSEFEREKQEDKTETEEPAPEEDKTETEPAGNKEHSAPEEATEGEKNNG